MAIQVLRVVGVERCQTSLKKGYEDVRFNVISITRGWVGNKFPEKSGTRVALNGPNVMTFCVLKRHNYDTK